MTLSFYWLQKQQIFVEQEKYIAKLRRIDIVWCSMMKYCIELFQLISSSLPIQRSFEFSLIPSETLALNIIFPNNEFFYNVSPSLLIRSQRFDRYARRPFCWCLKLTIMYYLSSTNYSNICNHLYLIATFRLMSTLTVFLLSEVPLWTIVFFSTNHSNIYNYIYRSDLTISTDTLSDLLDVIWSPKMVLYSFHTIR